MVPYLGAAPEAVVAGIPPLVDQSRVPQQWLRNWREFVAKTTANGLAARQGRKALRRREHRSAHRDGDKDAPEDKPGVGPQDTAGSLLDLTFLALDVWRHVVSTATGQ